MEEKTTVKKLDLVHKSTIYRMIIPEQVEKKIRLLCREIHNVEWSGILFYKVDGTFEDSNLVITCVDIFQMDEGNSTYTEYNMSPDVCNYICEHPELTKEGIYQGLIHSHNNMPTFLSGTDTNTLQSEGSDMSHFVSLIVNNAGKYTARITRRVKDIFKGSRVSEYPTWGGKSIKSSTNNIEVEDEYIENFDLNIEIEGANNDFEKEMLDRIKEIRNSKVKTTTAYSSSSNFSFDSKPQEKYTFTPNTPEKVNNKIEDDREEIAIDYDNININEDIVDWVLKQSITCSVILPKNSKIDINTWVKNMDTTYEARFGSTANFEGFASSLVDYLVNYTVDAGTNAESLDSFELSSVLAYKVREKLSKLPKNKWLNCLMKLYDDYIF